MKIKIGIKDLSKTTQEAIDFLAPEEAYKKIKTISSQIDSYNSLKDDIRLGVDFNMARKRGAKIKSITKRKRGFFTEYTITI